MILGWCTDTRYGILAGKVWPREFVRLLDDCVYKCDPEIRAIERSRAQQGMSSAEIIEVTMKAAYKELTKLNKEERGERYRLLIQRLFHGQLRTACLELIKDSTTGQEIFSVGEDVAMGYEEKVKRVVDSLCAESSERVKDNLLRMKPSDDEIACGMKKIFNEHWRYVDKSGDSKEARC